MVESAAHEKDAQLTFRIASDLKRELESIAAAEGRGVAQICEAFLRGGSETYKKKGSGVLQRYLAQSLPGTKRD
jgi:hypothetical protein